jgi:hypothetical protein
MGYLAFNFELDCCNQFKKMTKIYDRASTTLVHCFLLKGVTFKEDGLLVLLVLLLQEINH